MEELKQYQLPTNQKRRQALEDALFTATALYNRVNQEMDYYTRMTGSTPAHRWTCPKESLWEKNVTTVPIPFTSLL